MQNLLRVALASCLWLVISPVRPINANSLTSSSPIKRIQSALNKKNISTISNLFEDGISLKLNNRYMRFIQEFPNAKWIIREVIPGQNESYKVEVLITGGSSSKGKELSLKAKQILILKTKNGKITNQNLVSEMSIIQNGAVPVSINLNVPEAVLTGSRYDFDVIIEKPLESIILAGGLISISSNQFENQISPEIELLPLAGGGLFKSVKAPLKPGSQHWAAVIVHPESVISITKMVRVVSDQSDLNLYQGLDSISKNSLHTFNQPSSSKAATPGKNLPSSSSRLAPPPVEI